MRSRRIPDPPTALAGLTLCSLHPTLLSPSGWLKVRAGLPHPAALLLPSVLCTHNPTSFWDPQSPLTSFWDPKSRPASLSLHTVSPPHAQAQILSHHSHAHPTPAPFPSLPVPREVYPHPTFPRGFLLSALPGSCSTSTSLSPCPTLFIAVSTFPVLYPWFYLSQSSVLGGEWQRPNHGDRLPAPATTPQLLISPSKPRIRYLAAHRTHREHPIHAELRLRLPPVPGELRLHPRVPHTEYRGD